MKKYVKPEFACMQLVSNECIANENPWGSFADNLESLGGSITSYEYGSGIQA